MNGRPTGGGPKSILFLVVILAVVTAGFLYLCYRGSTNGEEVDVIIPRGSSSSSVAERLEGAGVIRSATLMRFLLRLTAGSKHVRAGEFRFKHDMRLVDAIHVLYHDEPILHQITIPEGWTAKQIAQALAVQGLGNEQKFERLMLSSDSARKYHLSTPSLEGFLFPDTYAFSKIDGEERIVDRMVQEFFRRFDKSLQDEAKAKGWTVEALVTLASIIEKETGVPSERGLVSSVFHNRLTKRMRLQSDPTIIYGLPNYDGKIHTADIHRPTPYNTYVIPALPPGPISNPGMASLLAALRPASTNYLYFVSNNQGSHIFSETYGQHARHVNNYQKRQ